jgi:uncharacterized protein (DUF1800 family)
MGVDKWIEHQLAPETIEDPVVSTALAAMPTWTRPIAEIPNTLTLFTPAPVKPPPPPLATVRTTLEQVRAEPARNVDSLAKAFLVTVQSRATILDQFNAGKIIRAEHSERQLYELMVDFWENHFSVYTGKMPSQTALIAYERESIRPFALGKFRDLLGAVAHSPAMMNYLDNYLSTKRGLNENYARELMELHTLGVDGGYTQQDVIEVARVLTGWGHANAPMQPTAQPAPAGNIRDIRMPSKEFKFNPQSHDSAEKSILGVKFESGHGMEEGERVLDLLARHPSTARFISAKLARFFVSDEPPDPLVRAAAEVFTRTDGDIRAVVRTIVTSPEFFSHSAFRAKVKTPYQLIVSARRALEAPADSSANTVRLVGAMGHPLFGRLTPDGWPDAAPAWINSGSMMKRFMLVSDIVSGRTQAIPVRQWSGWSLSREPADKQMNGVIALVLGGIADAATKNALRLTQGETTPMDADQGHARLSDMLVLALGSPEFQKR